MTGLGRLTPGCNCCGGCDGSFAVDTCSLSWTTTGAYEVEVRYFDGADTFLISTNQSGELNNPDSGTFSLWVRCSAGGELVEVDSVEWTQAEPGSCGPCCEALGYDTTGIVVPVQVTLVGDPIFEFFNGTYAMTGGGDSEECVFVGQALFDDLDPDDCDTVNFGETCTFNSALFDDAFFLGTRVYTDPGGVLPSATFDLYGFPVEINIVWQPHLFNIQVGVKFKVWGFMTSESYAGSILGTGESCCKSFGECTWPLGGALMACGATTACGDWPPPTPPSPPCGGMYELPLYEGYDIGGTFAVPTLNSFCFNIIR